MQKILDKADSEGIQVLANEFIVSVNINSKENIPIELLNYLRKHLIEIQDGKLFNDLCHLLEKKYNFA